MAVEDKGLKRVVTVTDTNGKAACEFQLDQDGTVGVLVKQLSLTPTKVSMKDLTEAVARLNDG